MADEQKTAVFRVTNKAPGPRMVLTATGGHSLQKDESKVLRLSENDVKGIQPYIDLKHFVLEPASEDDLPKATSVDIGGEQPELKTGNPVDAATVGGEGDIVPEEPTGGDDDDGLDDEQSDGPTHVEHRGFGRFYGMRGDEKITQAMNEDEANAYAAEHNLQSPVTPDPSDEGDVTDPGDGGGAESTDNTEDAGDGAEQQS